MTKLTCEALDSVGKARVQFQLDRDLFPLDLIAECARNASGVSLDDQGTLTLDGPSPHAWSNLRDFSSELISAKRALL
jgi:hypothetical protein